jgi:hypothetical protein
MIAAILQRIEDLTRERRIRQHTTKLRSAMDRGDKGAARWHCDGMQRELLLRSPDQVERMERRLRARAGVRHA